MAQALQSSHLLAIFQQLQVFLPQNEEVHVLQRVAERYSGGRDWASIPELWWDWAAWELGHRQPVWPVRHTHYVYCAEQEHHTRCSGVIHTSTSCMKLLSSPSLRPTSFHSPASTRCLNTAALGCSRAQPDSSTSCCRVELQERERERQRERETEHMLERDRRKDNSL